MNPLLQTLYHVARIRSAVFGMPIDEQDPEERGRSAPLALKQLFYHLQYDRVPGSTARLEKALGWTGTSAGSGLHGTDIHRIDVVELGRILFAKLNEQVKGTGMQAVTWSIATIAMQSRPSKEFCGNPVIWPNGTAHHLKARVSDNAGRLVSEV